ncbi:hypothetical protein OF83DRAFT_1174148, partial [Amylostereum chailletii]
MSTPSSALISDIAKVLSKEDWSATVDSETIIGVIRDFLSQMQWEPVPTIAINETLEAALLTTVSSWDVDDKTKEELFSASHVAARMISVSPCPSSPLHLGFDNVCASW